MPGLIIIILLTSLNTVQALENPSIEMKKNFHPNDRFLSYGSCIVVLVFDQQSNRNYSMVFQNGQFAEILARQQGVDISTYNLQKQYLEGDYFNYMKNNLGQYISVDFGKPLDEIDEFSRLIIRREYSFKDFGVDNERDFINKFFDYTNDGGSLRGEYFTQYNFDPSFIALLNKLGYFVVWSDYIAVLSISTNARK